MFVDPSLKCQLLTFLVVQWLRLHDSTAEGVGSIPGWGAKIPHAPQLGQKRKKPAMKKPELCKAPNHEALCQKKRLLPLGSKTRALMLK